MASLLSKLSAGQLWELNSAMAKRMTPEEALKLLNNPGVWEKMVTSMREAPAFRFAHGVWCPSNEVLASENSRLTEAGVKLDDLAWISFSEPPERTDEMERDEAWALETTLATLGETFEFYAKWLLEQHELNWRWEDLKSDSDNMRLIEGQEFKPNTRRWRRVMLNANLGSSAQDTVAAASAEDIASLDVLAALAQNPERVRKMDGQQWCFVTIAGIVICLSGFEPWSISPYVRRRRRRQNHGRVDLSANEVDGSCSMWSCPGRIRELEV